MDLDENINHDEEERKRQLADQPQPKAHLEPTKDALGNETLRPTVLNADAAGARLAALRLVVEVVGERHRELVHRTVLGAEQRGLDDVLRRLPEIAAPEAAEVVRRVVQPQQRSGASRALSRASLA